MSSVEMHEEWLNDHLRRRTGERKGRLERGHAHGERLFVQHVWLPLRGDLDHLHPEYEVLDWRGKPYFADFVWLPGYVRLMIEVKGFGMHVQEMDRRRYDEELNREVFAQGLGYRIVSFSYDEVARRPELCIMLLRGVIGMYEASKTPTSLTNLALKEIVLLAFRLARRIRPKVVEEHLDVSHRTAVRFLHLLCEKGWMQPVPCKKGPKVLLYELVISDWNLLG